MVNDDGSADTVVLGEPLRLEFPWGTPDLK